MILVGVSEPPEDVLGLLGSFLEVVAPDTGGATTEVQDDD